jgi:hypothetical protein
VLDIFVNTVGGGADGEVAAATFIDVKDDGQVAETARTEGSRAGSSHKNIAGDGLDCDVGVHLVVNNCELLFVVGDFGIGWQSQCEGKEWK